MVLTQGIARIENVRRAGARSDFGTHHATNEDDAIGELRASRVRRSRSNRLRRTQPRRRPQQVWETIVVTFGRRRQTIEHLVIRRTSPFPAPQRLLEVGDFPLVALGLN